MPRLAMRIVLPCFIVLAACWSESVADGGLTAPDSAPQVASAPEPLEHTILLEEEEVEAPLPWPENLEEPLIIEQPVPEPSEGRLRLNIGGGVNKSMIPNYKARAEQNPGDFRAQYNLGVVYAAVGEYEAALPPLREAVRLKPDDAASHNYLGLVYSSLRRFGDAIDSSKKALSLDPAMLEPKVNLVISYEQMGLTEQMLEPLLAVVEKLPNDAYYQSLLGWVEYQLGHPKEAIQPLQDAIRLGSKNPRDHRYLGEAFLALGQYEWAIQPLRRAISMTPGLPEPHYNLGTAYANLDRCLEALKPLKEAIAIEPNFAEAHGNLGACYHKLGRADKARAEYNAALALDPGLTEISDNLRALDGAGLATAGREPIP